MIVCPDMSSKLCFQVHYGDYYISHNAYGVDLSAFERRECGIDKPLERSFGSIRKWIHEIFNVNPKTHFLTVHERASRLLVGFGALTDNTIK